MSFELVLHDVVEARSVGARLDGDITGTAAITFEPDSAGTATALHLVAELAPSRPLLRAVTRLAPPVARYGHDHIVDRAVREFGARALA